MIMIVIHFRFNLELLSKFKLDVFHIVYRGSFYILSEINDFSAANFERLLPVSWGWLIQKLN